MCKDAQTHSSKHAKYKCLYRICSDIKTVFWCKKFTFPEISSHNRKWMETVLLLEKYSLNLNKYV